MTGTTPFPIRRIEANGLEFAYIEAGAGPLVLLLHGFPDSARTWEGILPRLADAGFHAVAPFTRGYYPSAIPADGDYSVATLARDALALINAFGAERAVIVGHDWGASTAYAAANLAPEKVAKLVTLAIPHPRVIRLSFKVLRRLPHFLMFQWGPLSRWFTRRGDMGYIEHLYRYWSPSWQIPREELEQIKDDLRRPGRLKAALGYYHCLFMDARDREKTRLYRQPVAVPTLTFAGMEDPPYLLGMFAHHEAAFRGPFEQVEVPHAGHFLHREQPELFADKLLEFLRHP
jgi:pimeloyl-ACP methyl ester carboxylesterase